MIAFFNWFFHRQVIDAHNHIFGWADDWIAAAGLEQVLRCQHELARFLDRGCTQRHVDSHLVTVKVSVEGGTGERVQVDGTAFNQRDLKGLNTQAVQRRRTVEQHRALFADIFQHIPHLGALAINHAFGALDVVGVVKFNQAAHDKGLEEF